MTLGRRKQGEQEKVVRNKCRVREIFLIHGLQKPEALVEHSMHASNGHGLLSCYVTGGIKMGVAWQFYMNM